MHQKSPGGIPRLLVREKLAQRARKQHLLPILGLRGELFHAHAHTAGPSRATNIARRTQKHGDIETNNTTARPEQGTYETRITSAPENCTKNAHFSPAKAMAVSIPHRPQRAKAIGFQTTRPPGRRGQAAAHASGGRARAGYKRRRPGGTGGPGCGARGRWRGLAGLRADAPSEARGVDGSRAGRHPRRSTAEQGPAGKR